MIAIEGIMARLLRFAAALLIATLALDGAPADAPIVIKFSHGAAEDSPKGKAAEYFKKLAEARTGGRVRVEIFPAYLLYGQRDELEAVPLGAGEMVAAPLAHVHAVGVRFDEVQRFLAVADHAYVGSALVVNTKFGGRLPRDIRGALEGAAREATR